MTSKKGEEVLLIVDLPFKRFRKHSTEHGGGLRTTNWPTGL
jgi:hypothetical protein